MKTSTRRRAASLVVAHPASLNSSPLSTPASAADAPLQPPLAPLLRPIASLLLLLVFSCCLLFLLLRSLPVFSFPTSLPALRTQAATLAAYADSGPLPALHIASVLSALFLFKQAFSVPGSLLLNFFFGALYSPFLATSITCLLTALGSLGAYYAASTSAPLVRRLLPRPLAATRAALHQRVHNNADLFRYLLVARLFPLLPYAVLNLIAGVLNLPVLPFFLSLLLGSLPFNLITTQIGDLIANHLADSVLHSSSNKSISLANLLTPGLVAKLVFLTLVSLAPVLFKKPLNALLSPNLQTPTAITATPASPALTDEESCTSSSEETLFLRDLSSLASPSSSSSSSSSATTPSSSSLPFIKNPRFSHLANVPFTALAPYLRFFISSNTSMNPSSSSAASDIMIPAVPDAAYNNTSSHVRSRSWSNYHHRTASIQLRATELDLHFVEPSKS